MDRFYNTYPEAQTPEREARESRLQMLEAMERAITKTTERIVELGEEEDRDAIDTLRCLVEIYVKAKSGRAPG